MKRTLTALVAAAALAAPASASASWHWCGKVSSLKTTVSCPYAEDIVWMREHHSENPQWIDGHAIHFRLRDHWMTATSRGVWVKWLWWGMVL